MGLARAVHRDVRDAALQGHLPPGARLRRQGTSISSHPPRSPLFLTSPTCLQAAIDALFRVAAVEFGPFGVRFNVRLPLLPLFCSRTESLTIASGNRPRTHRRDGGRCAPPARRDARGRHPRDPDAAPRRDRFVHPPFAGLVGAEADESGWGQRTLRTRACTSSQTRRATSPAWCSSSTVASTTRRA